MPKNKTQTKPRNKTNRITIRKVDDATIEVELKMRIRDGAAVDTTFRQKVKCNYFDEVKDFVHTLAAEGFEFPLNEYARLVIQPRGTEGVTIGDDVIVVENVEMFYLIIRYLMLRRGYSHDIAVQHLFKYEIQIDYEWTLERRVFELTLLALNSVDFETVADMLDRTFIEINRERREAEGSCKKKLEKLKEDCKCANR